MPVVREAKRKETLREKAVGDQWLSRQTEDGFCLVYKGKYNQCIEQEEVTTVDEVYKLSVIKATSSHQTTHLPGYLSTHLST